MTNVSTDHPFGIPYIEFTEEGRKISFQKDCMGEIRILRQIDNGDWTSLVQNIRSPFVDTEEFPPGTRLSYKIELEYNGETKQYELKATL